MPPTANAGAPPANITFASLPTSVPLDGSASTASSGSIITWAWQIVSAPPGSAAALSATNVANPTLNNVDLPGTYYLILNVQQTNGDWAWDPDPASGDLENTPNDMPTARLYIAVEQEFTATVPPALGERTMQGLSPGDVGYTSAWAKWLALWYAVDAMQGELDAFTASPSFDDLYVDNIYEKTLGHTIVLKDDVTSEGSIFIALGEALSTTAITTPISQDLTIGAGDDISITATGDLTMGAGGPVAIAAGAAQSVTITGGALYPDLLVNEIDPSSGATITVNGLANVDAGGGVHRLDTTETTGQLKLTAAGDESSPFTFNLSVYGTTSLKGRAQVEAGMDVDVIDQLTTAGLDITGANGVRVNHAAFTGTTAADSTMAISGITADDSGAVFISLDGAGNLITAQATTVSLASGATLKTDTIGEVTAAAGVTVDGVLIKDGSIGGAGVTSVIGNFSTGSMSVLSSGSIFGQIYHDGDFNIEAGPVSTNINIAAGSGAVLINGDHAQANCPVYSTNVRTIMIPLAVKPGTEFIPGLVEPNYQGQVITAFFTAAVAATSAGGTITVQLFDGNDDSAISSAETIDGVTSPVSLTISAPDFQSGFYADVASDNGDAIQGAGLTLTVRYTISGAAS